MEKFNIVDTWKLWQRSQEEIVQSEKEMTQFMKSLYDMRIKLQEDRQMYLQALSGSSLQQLELQSKANIVLLEINRFANTLEKAISSFRRDSSFSVIIDACADLENDKESVIQYNELEEEDDESDYESSSEDEDDSFCAQYTKYQPIADDYSLRSLKTSVYNNLNSRAGEGVGILGDKTYPGEWIENSFSHKSRLQNWVAIKV
ncbi:hypothetical protein DAPPUDRAFT_117737 [Daphnia pulex]|uniref:Uncharacterized protein n=1 Tax=Daphnia pulex TaxID=6669 RepID=E9HTM6_DAPPU|nr:hypothetical protein DAPPUDRAFT_117737 [Daphnia pulex]|eukprot:EFX64901.1 hypothetical protein DAPPUDRAFT_117737 [Daphnia pulex]